MINSYFLHTDLEDVCFTGSIHIDMTGATIDHNEGY